MNILRWFAMLIIFLSLSLTGCTETEPLQGDSDIVNDRSHTFVGYEDIIAATEVLAPRFFEETPIDQSYLEEYRYNLNQVYADDGERRYLAAFSNGLGFQGVAMVFLLEDGRKTPIYFESHGERIESVKLFFPDYSDLLFLEIVSYGASGSYSAQRVELLLIDDRNVIPVWDYRSVHVDSRGSGYGDAIEVAQTTAAWVVVPSYQVASGTGPAIYVSETSNLHLVDGEGTAVLLEQAKRSLLFQWDPSTRKFVETVE